MTYLFQWGDFTLHGGWSTAFKIDCDGLHDNEILTIAKVMQWFLPPYGAVEGVPRGGLRLAQALEEYVTAGPLLIADDVLTTGGSMEEHRAGRDALGVVIFARGPCPEWVMPMFSLYGSKAL